MKLYHESGAEKPFNAEKTTNEVSVTYAEENQIVNPISLDSMYVDGHLVYAIRCDTDSLQDSLQFINGDNLTISMPRRIKVSRNVYESLEFQNAIKKEGFYPVYNYWEIKVETQITPKFMRFRGRGVEVVKINNLPHSLQWGLFHCDQLTIRGNKDVNALCEQLTQECAERLPVEFSSDSSDPTWRFLGKKLLICYRDNVCLGFASVEKIKNKLKVWTTYIDPASRNKLAFGALMAEIWVAACEENCEYVEASTDPLTQNHLNDILSKYGFELKRITYRN